MKTFQGILRIVAIALVAWAVSTGVTNAQTVSQADRAALAGPWKGNWSSDTHEYEASLTMQVAASGRIDGAITWTLRKSNRPDYQSKIGMTGTEFVRGQFDPDTSLVTLNGYRLDDPNKILGTDRYRMVVGDSRKTMGGITWSHDTWSGRIFLRR